MTIRSFLFLLCCVLPCMAQPTVLPAVNAAIDEGEALQKKGELSKAMEKFRWCANYAKSNQDVLGQAVCEQLIGGIDRLQGDYPAAEEHYRLGLSLAEKAPDPKRVSYILNNLANLYGAQGRYPETIAMLRQCLDISERAGNNDDAAPYQNLAITYALQGDHARALTTFFSALKIYERLGQKNKIALVHYNMGVLSMKQGDAVAAKRELLEALRLADGDQYVTPQALGDLGRVQDLEGHPLEAKASFEKVIAICRKSDFKACIAEGELNLGNFHLAHWEAGLAEAAFLRAQEVFGKINDSFNLSQVLRGLGYAARLSGDSAKAREHANAAVELSRSIGDPDGQWQALGLLGLAGDRATARDAFQRAIQIIETQRGKVGGGETEQQRFFEKALFPYQELALLEAAEKHPLAALLTAERARARALRDMLSAPPEQIGSTMTQTERTGESRLLATIAGLNTSLARASAAAKPALRERYERAWGDYESFRAALYSQHPEVRASRGEAPVATAKDIAALLPDSRSALIEFVCAEEKTLLLVATKGPDAESPVVASFLIPISRADLAKRAAAFRAKLEARDPGFRKEARELFRLLLEPAKVVLVGRTHIQLVADGPLWELPFQALLDPAGKYWIETRTISWAPSLTFLRDQSRRPRQRGTTLDLLAFADPSAVGMPAVPILRGQVSALASLYPADRSVIRVGAAADEQTFRKFAPQAKVIHLATHGIVDTGNALRSKVLLASAAKNAANTSGDGWLEAWELMRLDLKADLAVLSACETGRGRVTGGEGLVGLTWALFAAGVRHAVVSQWSVESESTTALMTAFHQRVRKGEGAADALRNSSLSLMKDPRYKHPFYWSAFIAAGKD